MAIFRWLLTATVFGVLVLECGADYDLPYLVAVAMATNIIGKDVENGVAHDIN